jgi:hypothetical protein
MGFISVRLISIHGVDYFDPISPPPMTFLRDLSLHDRSLRDPPPRDLSLHDRSLRDPPLRDPSWRLR